MKKYFLSGLLLILSLPIFSSDKDTISILFVGDMMQHYKQIRAALTDYDDSTNANAYNYSDCFKYVKDKYKKADFAIANMEFTVGITPYTGYPNFSAPVSFAQEVKDCGIDLFLCANNHLCDKGKRGIDSTIANYGRYNMPFTGLFNNQQDMDDNYPYITQIGNIKVAFINFTYGLNGYKVPTPYIISTMNQEQVKNAITKAKKRGAEVIIALPHWGVEYSLTTSSSQKEWRDFLHSNGVNIIIGSHPHVIQPVEINRNQSGNISSVVAYSLGNVISNMTIVNSQVGSMFTIKLAKDQFNNIKIISAQSEWTWCAIAGRIEKNYTVLPIKKFIHKKDQFISEFEYNKMLKTYQSLSKIFNNK